MNSYIIGAAIIVFIWIINSKALLYGIRKRNAGEIYHHTGMGLFFTLIAVEYFYGKSEFIFRLDILWLKIIGYVLFIPSVIFIFSSIYQLKIKNKAGSLGPEGTNRIIETGIFSIMRHPMWMGFSLWSLALMLHFQSAFSIVFGTIAIICFRIASNKEDDHGIKTFGDKYREYIERVPMWNFVRGLF